MSLSSKWRARRAKPSSRPSRLKITTQWWPEVGDEAGEARALLEAGEDDLVDRDHRQARDRHLERLVMEERDAQERQREENELERDAGDLDRLGRGACPGKAWQHERQAEHPQQRPAPTHSCRHRDPPVPAGRDSGLESGPATTASATAASYGRAGSGLTTRRGRSTRPLALEGAGDGEFGLEASGSLHSTGQDEMHAAVLLPAALFTLGADRPLLAHGHDHDPFRRNSQGGSGSCGPCSPGSGPGPGCIHRYPVRRNALRESPGTPGAR